jgi:hypothetical protein
MAAASLMMAQGRVTGAQAQGAMPQHNFRRDCAPEFDHVAPEIFVIPKNCVIFPIFSAY